MRARVASIESITPRVRRFTFVTDRGAFPAFSGGSHVGIALPTPGETRRNFYSITNSPWHRGYLQIAVQRDPASRGGSAWLHESVGEGDELEISPPQNQFPLVRTARRHLLIAGGIGITPFLSQIATLERWGAEFELHDIFRGKENAAFLPELRAAIGDRLIACDTEAGPRPDISALLARQPLGTHVYVCGPAALIATIVETAGALGWPKSQIHFERFAAAPQPETRPFVARLAKSGYEIHVPPELTLLEALERAGVSVPSSCRIGGCGTCEIPVADGEIDHRDHCWTDDDRACGKRLLACVSRARNDHLHLDL